jgi:hypothetical protein
MIALHLERHQVHMANFKYFANYLHLTPADCRQLRLAFVPFLPILGDPHFLEMNDTKVWVD